VVQLADQQRCMHQHHPLQVVCSTSARQLLPLHIHGERQEAGQPYGSKHGCEKGLLVNLLCFSLLL
jgi:hypothetical protein